MRRIWFLAAVTLGLFGCSEDDRPPTWSYIHEAIIEPNCTTSACHSDISEAADVELHDLEQAYATLVGVPCGEPTTDPATRNFVAPGDPTRSRLVYLLRGIETRNMPPDIPLPEVDVELIERWILGGAPCD